MDHRRTGHVLCRRDQRPAFHQARRSERPAVPSCACRCEIYPFSFPEYLKYQHFDLVANWEYNLKVKAELVKKFETYFYFGGFAETFPLKDKRSWLNSLFQKILLGDVISRNDIRNESSIRLIVKKLAESIMQPLALARILGVIKSAGCSLSYNTLVDYLQYLNDAYLIFGISNFSDKLSEKESIPQIRNRPHKMTQRSKR